MTTLLNSHLDQIALCSNSIGSLSFSSPKPFTNALLSQEHDITALIRDTEAHERALFHLAPPPLPPKTGSGAAEFGTSFSAGGAGTVPATEKRRTTTFQGTRQPRNRAVAAVLGGELFQKTRKEAAAVGLAQVRGDRVKGEVDVGVLLEGAEKLAAVYPIPGASDRIAQLRRRHQQLAANIAHYEGRVTLQSRELERMFGSSARSDHGMEHTDDPADAEGDEAAASHTRDDLLREEIEVEELERKKRALEDRVSGMERDLGGLMR